MSPLSHGAQRRLRAVATVAAIAAVKTASPAHALGQAPPSGSPNILQQIVQSFLENVGALAIGFIAVILAFYAIWANLKVTRQRLAFEERMFEEERKFREQEYRRFSQPAADLAQHISQRLMEDPHWARQALEDASLIGYSHTLFGERSHHFKEEKRELADRFGPYLLRRCKEAAATRQVYLLIDSGTTLFPFFRLLGIETAKYSQRREEWLNRFHLATNNLPGVEELMRTGKKVHNDRYSELAVADCQLLPGVPMPVFAAVAGNETSAAIQRLRERAVKDGGDDHPLFLSLVVGNWIRIKQGERPHPVPMARGNNHCRVKEALIANSDEVYVISPLGKIFVGQTSAAVNNALGFFSRSIDPDSSPYDEVAIPKEMESRIKLVSTARVEGRLLHRHSCQLEDSLLDSSERIRPTIAADEFAQRRIQDLPHLLFPFNRLPDNRDQEFEVEFPHYHTRYREEFLRMFDVKFPGTSS